MRTLFAIWRASASRRLLSRALIALTGTICLLAVLWQIRRAPETYPEADSATTSIYTLRAIKGELATGAYSRFHWHHPGPMLYQLLAPLYALSGRREVSLKWTMLILNLAVLATLVTYLGRRAKWLSLATALAFLPFIYFEQRLLFWAWNPVAPLLSVALAVALAAGVSAGEFGALPWLCGVVSFLVQSHVGLAPVSIGLAGAALAAAVLRVRTSRETHVRRAFTRALAISTVVMCVLWAAPVIHSVRTRPGNLGQIIRFVATSPPGHSWRDAADVVANELVAPFSPSRELITDDVPAAASWPLRIWAVVQLLLLAGAAAWSRRRGRSFDAAFAALCLLSSVIGLAAAHALVGRFSDYLVLWIGVIGILNTAALAATAVEVFRASPVRAARLGGTFRAAIAVYIAGLAVLGATRLTTKQRADSNYRVPLYLANEVAAYCDQHHYTRPILTFKWDTWRTATGLVLQLYKQDRVVAVNDDVAYVFGRPFAIKGGETVEIYLMPVEETDMPTGVTRYEWIASAAGYRLVRIFRH